MRYDEAGESVADSLTSTADFTVAGASVSTELFFGEYDNSRCMLDNNYGNAQASRQITYVDDLCPACVQGERI